MALAAFVAGETLKNIVDDCERIAANPGLNLDPLTKVEPIDGQLYNAPAYRWLIDIIRNLYLVHDWPFAIVARTLAKASDRCLLLPEDFWRVAYDNPLYGLIGGSDRFVIPQVTRPQFFDNVMLSQPESRGKPRKFYLARREQLIYLDPIEDYPYTYELHYFRLIPEETSINAVPEFPHRDYLRQALLVKYWEDQDDERISATVQLRDQMWMQIRGTIYDLREDPIHIPGGMLDSQWFTRVQFED